MLHHFAAVLFLARGALGQEEDVPWQVQHMKVEHGVDQFDALSFFKLHDGDDSRTWTRDDILNLYGLLKETRVGDGTGMGSNEQTVEIDEKTKEHVYNTILEMLDQDHDGVISIDEWRRFCEDGKVLPNFGLGTGHHGDYEYEYEVHHWSKYHQGVDPDVKIVHPEDIEHERLYHQYEHGDSGIEEHEGSRAIRSRIPKKFLRIQS